MTAREKFSNPPIVEASIQLGFDADWDAEIPGRLQSALREQYPMGPTHRPLDGESIAFITSTDQLRIAGFAPHGFSIHVLKPYPGWESFRNQARWAIARLCDTVIIKQLTYIGVRYIDRIALPSVDKSASPSDYFTHIPPKPKAMPSSLTDFQLFLQGHEDDGTRAALELGTTPSLPDEQDKVVIVYDLNIGRQFSDGTDIKHWEEHAEILHEREFRIFLQSITDKTKELFR